MHVSAMRLSWSNGGERVDTHALLLATDEPESLEPSLLILDGFNSLGQDDVNESLFSNCIAC
jgi:hypothetical protein